MNNHHDISAAGLRFAEAVLPGHPDKLADQIADAIVDIALAQDDRAIVQVEVAVHHNICHVNGRVSTAGGPLDRAYVEATVRGVYERAGFGVPFTGVGDGTDYQCPRPADVDVQLACTIDADLHPRHLNIVDEAVIGDAGDGVHQDRFAEGGATSRLSLQVDR